MSDMQNRKKQEQQKDTHLKDKIGLHTQIQKTSFPIKKKRDFQSKPVKQTTSSNHLNGLSNLLLLPRHRSSGSPVPGCLKVGGYFWRFVTGQAIIYIYTSKFVGWCWLKVLRNGRYKLLRKLFGGNYLGKVFRGGLQLSGYLSFLKTSKWKVLVVRREKVIQIDLNRKDAGTNV